MIKAILVAIALIFSSSVSFALDRQAELLAGLPVSIKNFLNKKYPGWQLTPVPDKSIQDCDKETRSHPSIATGDFNADGSTDFAMLITHGGTIHVLEFLSRGGSYSENSLFRSPIAKLSGTAIQVEKKGKPTTVGTVERVDGILVSDCGSIPLRFVFSNGRVHNVTPRD